MYQMVTNYFVYYFIPRLATCIQLPKGSNAMSAVWLVTKYRVLHAAVNKSFLVLFN
jgi:hypothetical protein